VLLWRIFRVALPRSWTGPPWFSDKVILLSVGALTLCLSLYVCSSCLVTVVVWVRPSWLLLSPPLPLRALLSPGAAQVSGFCSALPFPLGPCSVGFCSPRARDTPRNCTIYRGRFCVEITMHLTLRLTCVCSDLVNFDDVCLAVVIDSCLPLRVCVTVVEWADDLAEYTGSKPSDFDLSWLIGARRQRRLP